MAKLSAGKLDRHVNLPLGKDDTHLSMSKTCFWKSSVCLKYQACTVAQIAYRKVPCAASSPPYLPTPRLSQPCTVAHQAGPALGCPVVMRDHDTCSPWLFQGMVSLFSKEWYDRWPGSLQGKMQFFGVLRTRRKRTTELHLNYQHNSLSTTGWNQVSALICPGEQFLKAFNQFNGMEIKKINHYFKAILDS